MSHPVFARHETFHPRYGWLKKGVDLIHRKPSAFASDDVHMALGVGKNMATAIRYWCEAFGLIEPLESPLSARREGQGVRLTPTAHDLIAGAEALDPYLESTATLWWLHYQLIKTQKATAWNFAIDHFGRVNFSREMLLNDLKIYTAQAWPDHKVAESSLVKDVNLFLRMYAFDMAATYQEDSIDSPFVELGLITKRGDEYAFVMGAKSTLPDAIVAAACLDFSQSQRPAVSAVEAPGGARSISLTRLMQANLSPAHAFRLTEHSLYAALERICERTRELTLVDTAGVQQLAWQGDALKLASKLISKYYKHALS